MITQESINLSEDFQRLDRKLEEIEIFVFGILKEKDPQAYEKIMRPGEN